MEVIQHLRKAISLPLLCRDAQILDTSEPTIKERQGYKPLSRIKRDSPRRSNVKTWTRLMDNRPGTKVHPTIDEEEKIHIGSAPSVPPGGSSLDLAPSLMLIYDSYASTNRSYSSCAEAQKTSNVTDASNPQEHKNGYFIQDVNTNMSQNVERDSTDEKVVINMNGPMATSCGEVSVSLTVPDCAAGPPRCGAPPATILDVSCATPTLDTQNDAKKRPLSISSTTSSTSSTSSLPRHQRKKVATCSGLALSSLACGGMEDSPSHLCSAASELHDVDEAEASEEEEFCQGGSDRYKSSTDGRLISRTVSRDLIADDNASIEQSPRSSCRLSADVSASCHIENVISEIVDTERTYVCDLKDIIKGYLEYIDSSDEVDMPEEDVRGLFGNIEEIYQFNSVFLTCLEDCHAEPVKVAQCFVDKNDGFLVYSDYCTNYPRSVEVLTKCMREPQLADIFKQQQVSLKHGLPLGSYLLKPVQRILKYHLLLENIVNASDSSIGGKETFAHALASMTKMAVYINEMKRKHEHAVRIQEIQSTLFGWDGADLTTLGELAVEDTFRMCGAKAHRTIFLFERGILIAKKREDGNLLVKGFILCSNLMLIESIPKEPLSFHVIPFDNPRMQHTIQAKSLEQKRKWCLQIKKFILENYNAVIPDKAKELVMNMLGKSREEEKLNNSNLENIDPAKKQHTAPEYLEKRRGRRRSTSLIPDFGLLKSKKNAKKLDGNSPKSSPRLRRKSDVTSFLPRASPRKPDKDMIHECLHESDSEEKPEVVLRDQNQRGRRKNRPLSRSLESLNLEMSLSKNETNIDSSTECGATSYDDNCDKARRISLVLAGDSLRNLEKEDTRWDQGMVPSTVQGPCPDDTGGACAVGIGAVNDDGYCNVTFKGDALTTDDAGQETGPPYSNVLCKTGAASSGMTALEDGFGDYIKIASSESGESESSNYVKLYKPSSAISNEYKRISEHQKDEETIPSITSYDSPKGKADIGVYDNWQVGVYDNMLYADVSQQDKLAGHGVSNIIDDGIIKNCHTAIRTSAFTELCRPMSPASSHQDSKDSTYVDPWVPREMSSTGDNHDKSKLAKKPQLGKKPAPNPKPTGLGVCRNHSFGHFERPKRIVNKSKPALFRSNSFSSMDDIDQCDKKDSRKKGHQRRPSDLLVFSNRSAFLASPEERTVKPDPAITRAISRYATPPREMGPEDVIRDVKESKNRGKVVMRYATPPRTIMDPAKLHVLVDGAVIENSYSCEFGSEVKEAFDKLSALYCPSSPKGDRPATVAYDGFPIHGDVWSDVEDYMHKAGDSTSTSPTKVQNDLSPRPGSYHGSIHHSISPGQDTASPQALSPLSSPSSVVSNESIVGSLKNAVMSLTHKITGRSNSRGTTGSIDSSPSRTSRASSFSAFDDSKGDSLPRTQRASKDKEKRKEKRHRFVYQLARAYSDRVKQRAKTIKKRGKSLDGSETFSSSTKELNHLLQENKQGGSGIGARMADEPCTSVIGTYTLPRHRRKTAQQDSAKSGNVTGADLGRGRPDSANSSNGLDSGYIEDFSGVAVKSQNPAPYEVLGLQFRSYDSLEHSCEGSVANDLDSLSLDYYYEKKFMDDLEGSLAEEMFRDSGMYCEDGASSIGQSGHSIKLSIRETVQMIEKKCQLKSVNKTEIKRGEKAQGIQDKMKALEKAASDVVQSKAGEAEEDLSVVKSVRDRTRELVECARLTRIRQDSCTVVDDTSQNVGCSDSSGTSTPTRRGYVKLMVEQLQSGQHSNPESESEC